MIRAIKGVQPETYKAQGESGHRCPEGAGGWEGIGTAS